MGLPEGLTPVFVRCSSITDDERKPQGLKPQGLAAVIRRQAEHDGYPAAGALLVDEKRPMLFLLDGLDEVRDRPTRAAVCKWLRDEVARWPASRFAVTCRFAAYHEEATLGTDFVRADVEWLDPERVREFVHRWFRTVHEVLHGTDRPLERAQEQAEKLLEVVLAPERMQNIRLREMTENPLCCPRSA